jgi:hypothetical protein
MYKLGLRPISCIYNDFGLSYSGECQNILIQNHQKHIEIGDYNHQKHIEIGDFLLRKFFFGKIGHEYWNIK